MTHHIKLSNITHARRIFDNKTVVDSTNNRSDAVVEYSSIMYK